MSLSLLPELKSQQDFFEFVNDETHYEGVTSYEFDPVDNSTCVVTVTGIGAPRKAKCPKTLAAEVIQIMQAYSPMAAQVGDGPVFITKPPEDDDEAEQLKEAVKKMKTKQA